MKEYVVTLKNFDDLDNFYEDMETPGGSITIPGRRVECALRRNISRNTHYLLTEEEAQQVRNDSRVLAVELLPQELGIKVSADWTQVGNFEKSDNIDANDKNWGLFRSFIGNGIGGWGTNGTFTQTTQSIYTTSSGRNVDVVVVDSHINPDHPEFSVNVDGTGGSRVNLFDWFQYSSALGINTESSYDYTDVSSNHGTHVAGTLAGNTQGWARDSNIYNIEFNYTNTNFTGTWELVLFDYLRYFHKNKPINPNTGRRNPTVTNHSWGYSYNNINLTDVLSVNYRGLQISLFGMPDEQKKIILEQNGVPVPLNTYLYGIPARYTALDVDIQDAIADGVIVVSSAGNSYWNCSTIDNPDYNNFITTSSSGQIFHSRGSSPAAAPNVICVGSIGTTVQEYKSDFSNYGSRIDIWAPGSNIVSSLYSSSASAEYPAMIIRNDPRNSTYKLGSLSGTSMASPQVAGIIACFMEQEQNTTHSEIRNYILSNAKNNQLSSSGGNAADYTSLGTASNNKTVFYKFERPMVGLTQPKYNFKRRPSSGMTYPRSSIQRTLGS